MEKNSSKCKSYEGNLAENTEENSLYYVIGYAGINKSRILSGYIFTQYPY